MATKGERNHAVLRYASKGRLMDKLTLFIPLMIALVMVLSFASGIARAAHPIADEAKPTLPERLTENIVKGRLMMIEGEHVVIKVTDGEEIKLHADINTKMGEVKIGDKVKAYVNDSGHVTTIQRDE
ncbi:MAG TPA: hypothetical protein VJU54_04295 [Nitrospiraceae bacterium]|nr:hypothetical protein [Nitrospiraceae bacterium]